jgi:serine/threonine protein kinase
VSAGDADGLEKLGRYELITQIGQGGMAEVRLAIQRGPGGFEKLVVIKLIHDNLATQKTFVDMLMDEARVAALVKHPNVVDIYDLGHADGRYFIAMEYLEGEPLLSLLRSGRDGLRLDTLSTSRLIADTAEGLDAAHELRSLAGDPMELVHHDVSLGNIVVLYNGQVKLVDFGVAKATQRTAPQGKVHGKFGYMAPEKLRGSAGDRRSDIWSLGVVLWEALTLRRLFKGSNDKDTIKLVLDYNIPRPSAINGDVLPDLDPIVMRALERDPDRRYHRAQELAQDLEEVLRVNGYGGRNDQIARYMQSTFATHIEARKRLLQEVSTKGRASAAVLHAAVAEEPVPVPQVKTPTPMPMRDGPRNIRPSGEFAVSFRRTESGSSELPPPSRPTTRPGVTAQEIIARRTSDEMMAEGTPKSGVHDLPAVYRTKPGGFAEATPIIPESDLSIGRSRADTVQEPDDPELDLHETIVHHSAMVMDIARPDGELFKRPSAIIGVPAQAAIAAADASIELGELMDQPPETPDPDAQHEISMARNETLGRAISDVLARWPSQRQPVPPQPTPSRVAMPRPQMLPPAPQQQADYVRRKQPSTNSPLLQPKPHVERRSDEAPVVVLKRKLWPLLVGGLVALVVALAILFAIAG